MRFTGQRTILRGHGCKRASNLPVVVGPLARAKSTKPYAWPVDPIIGIRRLRQRNRRRNPEERHFVRQHESRRKIGQDNKNERREGQEGREVLVDSFREPVDHGERRGICLCVKWRVEEGASRHGKRMDEVVKLP